MATVLAEAAMKKEPQAAWSSKTRTPRVDRPRLQIDFTHEAYQHLNRMKEKANVKSTTEVARNALRLYDWYLEKQAEGFKLLLAKGNDVKQVELLL
jgi:hypothetical protein